MSMADVPTGWLKIYAFTMLICCVVLLFMGEVLLACFAAGHFIYALRCLGTSILRALFGPTEPRP